MGQRDGEYPELKIEKGIPLQIGNGSYRGGMRKHFFEQIEGMEIGDSFEIEFERYATTTTVHLAFKDHGWKGRLKTIKIARENNGRWKFRFWRMA